MAIFGHGDVHYLPINLVDARSSLLNNPLASLICDGVDECRKAARYALREGADFIKIFTPINARKPPTLVGG